jgi:protein-tyrosine phosphatase
VREEGLEGRIAADSAGTHAYHTGEPPNNRSIAAAQRRGYSMKGMIARQTEASDFNDFDLIMAMDKGHYDILQAAAPKGGRAHIAMFLDYAMQTPKRPANMANEVPDPYYGREEDFEIALDLIEKGAKGLLNHIKTRMI